MQCTCTNPARCPICNLSVRVPLSNLQDSTAGATLVDRFARRETVAHREALRRLIEGSTACPSCGSTIRHEHTRPCFLKALSSVGIPTHERDLIVSKITFPEA